MNYNLGIFTRKVMSVLVKNSPSILTGLGVAGSATSIFMAISAAKKAERVIFHEEETRRLEWNIKDEHQIVLTNKEKFEETWTLYIPTAIMFGISVGCMVGSTAISSKRNAALASLYSIAEVSLKEYQDKVLDTIGSSKEKTIREDILQDRLDKDPVEKKEISVTSFGDTLCYDSLSGRYFKNSYENIRKVQNDFNQKLFSDMWLSLNDFYYELGLEGTELGRNLGWTPEYGLMNIDFSAKLATNGEPCVVLNYRILPKESGAS